MAKIITSNNVVFMDTTDNRKLDVYITSNLPNAQIKNTNTSPITYTPNWISTPLKLEAGAYLDSQDVTSKTTFSWYKKGTDGREVLINANAQYITINTNDLDSSQLMVYICKALYKASDADTIGVEDVEQITFSQVTAGVDGTPGTSASLVTITPSALYFKSTTGKDGTFSPDTIYLCPRFQNATYSNWQYSIDGGANWLAASGANGLTIGTYNSVANSLAVSKSSTLYTDTITSISFRCNSTTSTVYDVVSIAKIYDVVDLQIGGANLLVSTKNFITDSARLKGWSNIGGYTIATDEDGFAVAIKEGIGITNIPHQGIYSSVIKATQGDKFTVSFWMKVADVSSWDAQVPVILELYNTSLVRVAWKDCLFASLNRTPYTLQNDTWTYCTLSFEINNIFTFAENKTWSDVVYLGIRLDLAKNGKIYFKKAKIEKGNKATDWSPASEDLINESSNVNVMLSNEAHFFTATASGVPSATNIVLDVVGYKGSIRSATTVGTITGLPSAGMTATIVSNNTTSTKITINVTSALTSDIADSGVLTIPVTVNGHTINKKFSWSKSKEGAVGVPGSDAITFRVYSSDGYALSANKPNITLQTFAYVGDVAITAGATYQWYVYDNGSWATVTGGTNSYLSVARGDVNFSRNYMCKMTFGGVEYVDVVTVDDKSDNSQMFTSKPSNYSEGDIWLVSSDYIPPEMTIGVLLKATKANMTYADADWILATKYDEHLKSLQENINTYNQYFSFDTTNGVTIGAKDLDGNPSQFSTSLTNERLSFNYGGQSIAYINGTKMNIKEAEIESPLTVTGKYSGSTMLQAPVINIGKFSIIVESNGSLSIIANT